MKRFTLKYYCLNVRFSPNYFWLKYSLCFKYLHWGLNIYAEVQRFTSVWNFWTSKYFHLLKYWLIIKQNYYNNFITPCCEISVIFHRSLNIFLTPVHIFQPGGNIGTGCKYLKLGGGGGGYFNHIPTGWRISTMEKKSIIFFNSHVPGVELKRII